MNLVTPASIETVTADELPVNDGYSDFLVRSGDLTTRLPRADLLAEIEGLFDVEIPAPYATRAAMIAATVPASQSKIQCFHRGQLLTYRKSASLTTTPAATTADGAKWWPATKITSDHWGAIGNGTTADRGPLQWAIDHANELTSLGGFPHQVFLGNGSFAILANQAHLTSSQSLILRGQGRDASKIKRFDYIGADPLNTTRRDCLRMEMPEGSNFTLEITGIGFEGDLMDPHPTGKGPTVAYRRAGAREWEGFVLGGTDTTIVLPPAAQLPVGQTYVGDYVQIDGGPGLGSEREIVGYDQGTNTITVDLAFNFMTSGDSGNWPSTATYVHIGRVAPGMGIIAQGLARLVVRDCAFTGIRNQVLNHTACRFVDVTGTHFRYYTRGGISGRRCNMAIYANNMFEFGSDDAIFNSTELPDDEWTSVSQYTLCTGNVLKDAQGFRFIGARHLQVTNNLLTRPITIGICVGPSGRESPVNQHAITVRSNTIVDMVNRNALAFDLEAGLFAAIRVASTSGVVEIDPMGNETTVTNFKVPGTVESGAVVKPGTNIWTKDADGAGDYYQPAIGVDVSDNSVLTTLEAGQSISDRNGVGTWYYKGTLRTGGFVGDTLTAADLAVAGLQFLGPFQDVTVIGNNLSTGGGPSIQFTNGRFGGNDHPLADLGYRYLQVARIDFDRALTGILVKDNRCDRNIAGLRINHGNTTTNFTYDITVEGNKFDCDPFHENALRVVDGGGPTGGWSSNDQWAVDINRCEGVALVRNEFSNCASPWRGPVTTHLDDNTIYARALHLGSEGDALTELPLNLGVRNIPRSGAAFKVIDMDCNPQAVTYLDLGRTALESETVPTTGRYVAGHFVRCTDPTQGVVGWMRRTTGSTHTSADWMPLPFGNAFASPEHFGAVGDGTADDTAAVQEAMNRAFPYKGRDGAVYLVTGTITAPAGKLIDFNGSTIKRGFKGGVLFANAGYTSGVESGDFRLRNVSLIDGGTEDTRGVFCVLSAVGSATVEGFKVRGSSPRVGGETTGAWALYMEGGDFILSGVDIDNFACGLYGDGIHLGVVNSLSIASGYRIEAGDDALAFHFPPTTYSWVNKTGRSANITVGGGFVASKDANGLRLGGWPDSPADTYWENVTIGPLTFGECGSNMMNLNDNRTPAQIGTGKNDNIKVICGAVCEHDASGAKTRALKVEGNHDDTDVANIALRNYGKVEIVGLGVEMNTSGSSQVARCSGVEHLVLTDCDLSGGANLGVSTPRIEFRHAGRVEIVDTKVTTETTGTSMGFVGVQDVVIHDPRFDFGSTAYRGILFTPQTLSGTKAMVAGGYVKVGERAFGASSGAVLGEFVLSGTDVVCPSSTVSSDLKNATRYIWNAADTRSSQTATILSGNTSVVVTHGLGVPPTTVNVTGRHQEVAGAWVSARSSTNITINVSAAVTADRTVDIAYAVLP